MTSEVQQFVLIEEAAELSRFYEENKAVEWLCFDTEFIGERRYLTLLCLIQVGTVNGFYMIDALKIKDLQPFFKLIEDPNILKITHAGDNDYRLLNAVGGVVPKNVFDIQLAAGFVGYKYPVSFRKLVGNELGIHLAKSYTVADWEARPLAAKALKYALEDVLYLYPIYERIMQKLQELNRVDWVAEENLVWEKAETYELHPYREALKGSLIKNLKPQQQAFLLRLYVWRDEEARRKNYSKEMILP
ncbi:MAG: ribonuclease D, partial [Bacteroidota bacterium]